MNYLKIVTPFQSIGLISNQLQVAVEARDGRGCGKQERKGGEVGQGID